MLRQVPGLALRKAIDRPGVLPTFVIVGAVRAGTTSLARYIGAHPEVFLAPRKELHFFDVHYERGTQWYQEQFAGVSGETAVGEATATYLYDPRAIPRMAALLPEINLIAILRNPIDRAYSHYWLRRARGKEAREFEEVVAAEVGRTIAAPEESVSDSYLDRGRYLGQLRRVLAHYPRESLHVLLLEDLRDSPGGAFASVCRSLGVDDSFVPPNLGLAMNPFMEFRSTRLRTRTRHASPLLRRLVGRLNGKRASYPPMAPSLRADLEAYFAAENAALADWLQRDLSAWGT